MVTKFRRNRNSLLDEEYSGKPLSDVILENVSAVRKMLIYDNRCTYHMIQKEFNIGSAAMYKITPEVLNMQKLVCCCVSHKLTEHEKAE